MKLAIGKILKQRGQTQASLADAMQVSRGYMSELVSGKKSPSPAMLSRMCEILEIGPGDLFETPPDASPDEPQGFGENAAVPFNGPASMTRQVAAMMQSHIKTPTLYVVRKSATGFGLMAGDVLVIELNYTTMDGDLVLATDIDDSGSATTQIYRLARPWLIPPIPDAHPVKIDETGRIAIVGVISGSVRGMKS